MKKLLLIFLIIIISESANSQSYQTREVVEKAEAYLKLAVGDELFNYFKLDPNSYYEYKTRLGKSKWENIAKNKKTKGIFVNGKDIKFVLEHPELPIFTTVYVPLAFDLSLVSEINLDKIPDFLLEGRKSDWLNDAQLDSILDKQNLKVSKEKLIKYLEFDHIKKEYYWVVINTINKEKCFSDVEILYLNPKSGEILKHFDEKHFVIYCH